MNKPKITPNGKRWLILVVVGLVIAVLLYAKEALFMESIETGWKRRAQVATERLGGRDLDECDQGLEQAFQDPKEVVIGPLHTYGLIVKVAGESMTTSYTYEDEELASFQLSSLPKGWIVTQQANNKTLSVIVSSSHCVFRLCTDNPLPSDICSGEKIQ